jgi:hypothetical protein
VPAGNCNARPDKVYLDNSAAGVFISGTQRCICYQIGTRAAAPLPALAFRYARTINEEQRGSGRVDKETVPVIRLAISCDICGAEKKQTNHWFVAYEHAGELRIGGWNSRYCKRAGSRHLCGQTCLHKLVDEFMAQAIAEDREMAAAEQASFETQTVPQAMPQQPPAVEPAAQKPRAAAQSFAHSQAACEDEYGDEYGSSARLIPTPAAASEMRPGRTPESPMPPAAETPKYASHQWRASAWERERKRETFGR